MLYVYLIIMYTKLLKKYFAILCLFLYKLAKKMIFWFYINGIVVFFAEYKF